MLKSKMNNIPKYANNVMEETSTPLLSPDALFIPIWTSNTCGAKIAEIYPFNSNGEYDDISEGDMERVDK